MRSSRDFASVTRKGRRARSGGLVVYLLPRLTGSSVRSDEPVPTKVGLIVGKSVGGSVARHLISRRLRAQLAGRVDQLPMGSGLVVRALSELSVTPHATESQSLGRQLDRALAKLAAPTTVNRGPMR